MLPPAPVLFSTRKVWPVTSVSFALMMRATWSVGPPAANDTMMRTGFEGYTSWACAANASATPRAAPNSAEVLIVPPPQEESVLHHNVRVLIDFFLNLKSHKLPVSI